MYIEHTTRIEEQNLLEFLKLVFAMTYTKMQHNEKKTNIKVMKKVFSITTEIEFF